MVEKLKSPESRQRRARGNVTRKANVLVSGSTGLVGQALLEHLRSRGHTTTRLVRRAPSTGEIEWDPAAGLIDRASIRSDVVVHLAGENIADGRWTAAKMEAIRSSRIQGTRLLSQSLALLPNPPKVLISASAIGFYGDRGDDRLNEGSPAGTGFLSEVCEEWERATDPARDAGIRVVNLRIGVVLARRGGALAKLLLPFKLGLGGKLGSGDQYMSWILIDDLVSILGHAIEDEGLQGAVNATSPEPVTNLEFTRALGRVLHRPTLVPMPAFAARLLLGRMADALLLASTRVLPEKLQRRGFAFEAPEIEGALRRLLEPGQ